MFKFTGIVFISNFSLTSDMLIVVDADGTLWDCLEEWYSTASEAWVSVEKTDFPMSYEKFYKYRWSVVRPEHIIQNAKLLKQGIAVPEDLEELNSLRWKYDVSEHVKAFYYCRRKAMQDLSAWTSKHKLYEGVNEMFSELRDLGTTNVVVTSKDRDSTEVLLRHFDIFIFIDKIYDGSFGRRAEQYNALSREHKTDSVIVYDDMPENLEVAISVGFIAIAAPQGYGREKDLAKYRKAYPNEFAKIVKELLWTEWKF